LKNIIAELDNLWAFNIVYRLDRVAQLLSEYENRNNIISKVGKKVLAQYLDKMEFLTRQSNKLTDLIKKSHTKNASEIYEAIKKHFGKLNRDESIEFIKNILKDLK